MFIIPTSMISRTFLCLHSASVNTSQCYFCDSSHSTLGDVTNPRDCITFTTCDFDQVSISLQSELLGQFRLISDRAVQIGGGSGYKLPTVITSLDSTLYHCHQQCFSPKYRRIVFFYNYILFWTYLLKI